MIEGGVVTEGRVGPLPGEEGKQILLPVTQTYTDGRTVAWDQPTPESGEEPEHPAPSLTVTAAETEGHAHGAGDTATSEDTAEQASAETEPAGTGLGRAHRRAARPGRRGHSTDPHPPQLTPPPRTSSDTTPLEQATA